MLAALIFQDANQSPARDQGLPAGPAFGYAAEGRPSLPVGADNADQAGRATGVYLTSNLATFDHGMACVVPMPLRTNI